MLGPDADEPPELQAVIVKASATVSVGTAIRRFIMNFP